ncbi:MAG: hypothetical protein DMD83_23725, partial [Candidatus Rokuibacteriota bacterium]
AKAADLSPLILKLKSLNPDVLIVAGIGQDAVLFWSQAKRLDLNVKAVVATSGGWGVPDFAKNLGEGANGVFSSDFPTEVNPSALTPHARELAQEFIKRFQAKKGTRPTPAPWCCSRRSCRRRARSTRTRSGRRRSPSTCPWAAWPTGAA